MTKKQLTEYLENLQDLYRLILHKEYKQGNITVNEKNIANATINNFIIDIIYDLEKNGLIKNIKR